ncbi:hypothetical protein ACLOJK_025612 [Asimina triloba]
MRVANFVLQGPPHDFARAPRRRVRSDAAAGYAGEAASRDASSRDSAVPHAAEDTPAISKQNDCISPHLLIIFTRPLVFSPSADPTSPSISLPQPSLPHPHLPLLYKLHSLPPPSVAPLSLFPSLYGISLNAWQSSATVGFPTLSSPSPSPPPPAPPPALSSPLPLPPSSSSSAVDRLPDLERLSVLGHGNGGTVYKVRHRRTHAIYALKLFHADTDSTTRRQILREIDILCRTDSPHLVRCHGVIRKPSGDMALLLEYMDRGTLESVLHRSGTFSERALASVARQVLAGLSYLHSHKIVHRDIKPSNLLFNSEHEIKIADFGVSKIMCRTLDACDSYVGTCAYMSPERFDPDTYGGNYDGYAADIWSLGLTLLELYIGHFPYLPPGQRPDWATLMCAICFGEPPVLPDSASEEFRSFVECCLQKDSRKRWTVKQLLEHPFVTREWDLAAGFEGLSLS